MVISYLQNFLTQRPGDPLQRDHARRLKSLDGVGIAREAGGGGG